MADKAELEHEERKRLLHAATKPTPAGLAAFKQWLGTPTCNCPSRWKSPDRLGGNGWVRIGTDPDCPYHYV